MIDRIYIDNFRTLVNCEIRLHPISLLLGPNGSGKSAVFDAVRALSRFIGGRGTASELFPGTDLTRWQSLDEQTFEVDLRTADGLCRYALKLDHAKDRRRCRVKSETLSLEGKPLFTGTEGEAQLFNDWHTEGPKVTLDWTRSGVSAVHARHDNSKLTAFRESIGRCLFLRSCPPMCETDSPEESEDLEATGRNFSSWYRYVVRQDIPRQYELFKELQEAVDGFDSLRLDGPADATATLRALIRSSKEGPPQSYKFSELSDGQRQLIILYTILFGMADDQRTLFVDEPDNYLAITEIEPWLNALVDAPGQSIGQAILISHHPEIIDRIAREKGIWLRREGGGPTRVETGRAEGIAPLKPSEREARGW